MDITEFIKKQTSLLKSAIEEGSLSKESPLIHEQKELLIEMLYELATNSGFEKEKGEIGLQVDKIFADELGVD